MGKLLVLAFVIFVVPHAYADCPDPRTNGINIVEDKAAPFAEFLRGFAAPVDSRDPQEVAELKFGLFSHWSGAFLNDGLMQWEGVDIQKKEVFHVGAFVGPRAARAPSEGQLPQGWFFRRKEDHGGHLRVEVGRVRKLETDELRMIMCLVNSFYETEDGNNFTSDEVIARETNRGKSDTLAEYKVMRAPGARASFRAKNRVAEDRRKLVFDYVHKLALPK